MKIFKVMICAIFVLFCGLFFAGCGEEPSKINFDENKIYVDYNLTHTYDGESHVFAVEYEDLRKVNVSYALDSNDGKFKPLSKFSLINAGTYDVFFKLSAKGYNTYISPKPYTVTIEPRSFQVFADDYIWFKGDDSFVYNSGYITTGLLDGDDINYDFICPDLDIETAEYGSEYDLVCLIDNPNYYVDMAPTKVVVGDYIQINKSSGGVRTFTDDIHEAIELAEDGDVVILNKSIEINKSIVVNKSLTFDGQNRYSIFANRSFDGYGEGNEEVKTMFMVKDSNVNLTLKDIKLNGNKTSRCVSAFAGNVVIDGAQLSNGKKMDNWRSGGVYITGSAGFKMTSGSITGNFANETDYTQYCADLWIGANANGSLASVLGGSIGDVFVNSNSYSAMGAGKFVLDGGNITNIYVEYDSGYGANFEYIKGNIEHLKIALENDDDGSYGVYIELLPVENTTYVGGKTSY